MKKLLILLVLSTSLSTFADSHLDFTISDFCYKQPGVQDRGEVYYFANEETGINASSICIKKDLFGQYDSEGNLKNGKKDGMWTWWHDNGQKKEVLYYKDGKIINGIKFDYYKSGQIFSKIIYSGEDKNIYPDINGKWIQWHSNGQKSWETDYKDGEMDGKNMSWYENGQIEGESTYKDGKQDGKRTWWYENGQIKSEENYKDGKLGGEFKKWDENGQESKYKDSKLHSILDRHENGQIKSILYYSKDFWNGNYEGWHDNGIKSYKGTFYLQKFNAVSDHTNWDRNGNVESFGQYNIKSFKVNEDKGLDTARKIGTWIYIIDGEEVEVKDEWTYFKETTLKEGE